MVTGATLSIRVCAKLSYTQFRSHWTLALSLHTHSLAHHSLFPAGIIVEGGGLIELFGKQYAPTWSRLAAPAFPGQDRVRLQQAVNWESGQRVLLVSSFFRDADYDMNEVLTIAAVSGNTVQFTAPIRFYHHAGTEYQNEVALLSRRILLQGDGSSDATGFGGHVMIKGTGRVQGVALRRMGQNNTIARYPLHFHMMGLAPTSYFKDNSVYDAFFRCYTIHGTHNTLVTRNVAFNTKGHCYYMEDGVEENNTISFNLAAKVAVIGAPVNAITQFTDTLPATPDRELPADAAASGFYITNMQNYVVGARDTRTHTLGHRHPQASAHTSNRQRRLRWLGRLRAADVRRGDGSLARHAHVNHPATQGSAAV